MAERDRTDDVPDKREEATNLAREAVEELEHGDREEGKFLAQEARELDAEAADAVLEDKSESQGGGESQRGKSKSTKSSAAKSGKSSAAKSGAAKKSSSAGETQSKSPHSGGHSAERTTDHDTIRAWVEQRNGRPAVVKRTHDTEEGGGILRIDFDQPEPSLETVLWDEFFKIFEERKLAFLFQDRTADGQLSRFFKFVHREDDNR